MAGLEILHQVATAKQQSQKSHSELDLCIILNCRGTSKTAENTHETQR